MHLRFYIEPFFQIRLISICAHPIIIIIDNINWTGTKVNKSHIITSKFLHELNNIIIAFTHIIFQHF